MPQLTSLDHLVLTVANIDTSIAFYQRVLGMRTEQFFAATGGPRTAMKFGNQKINLHEQGREFLPNANAATTGSADLCFLTDTDLADWQRHLHSLKIKIEEGPVKRSGATGPINSIYIRDPDRNLLEISNQL